MTTLDNHRSEKSQPRYEITPRGRKVGAALAALAIAVPAGLGVWGIYEARDMAPASYAKGTLVCTGSQEVDVHAGDTVTGILVDNVGGVNAQNMNDVAIEVAKQPGFKDAGPIETFAVPRYATDSAKPELSADQGTVDVPVQCEVQK